jgi:hypothetical protein
LCEPLKTTFFRHSHPSAKFFAGNAAIADGARRTYELEMLQAFRSNLFIERMSTIRPIYPQTSKAELSLGSDAV